MTESILNSTKKTLNLPADYTAFDPEIQLHINSVFADLAQLGVGPEDGFEIADADDDWATFIDGDKTLNMVKTYMYLRLRLLFDPPANSFTVAALEKQIEKHEWRLKISREKELLADLTLDDLSGFWWEIDENEGFPAEARPGDLGYDPNTGNVWRKL